MMVHHRKVAKSRSVSFAYNQYADTKLCIDIIHV